MSEMVGSRDCFKRLLLRERWPPPPEGPGPGGPGGCNIDVVSAERVVPTVVPAIGIAFVGLRRPQHVLEVGRKVVLDVDIADVRCDDLAYALVILLLPQVIVEEDVRCVLPKAR